MDAETRRERDFHAAMEDVCYQAAWLRYRPTRFLQEKATLTVLERAEVLSEHWVSLDGEPG